MRVRSAPNASSVELSVARPRDTALLQAAATRYRIHGVRLELTSDFPVAAGLGGSSAASVASIAAINEWMGKTLSREEIAEASRDLEVIELGIAGGRQDHYAAAFGGALALRFGQRTSADSIPLSETVAAELPRRCLVCYTGESRISASTITAVMDAYQSGNGVIAGALRRMRALAEQMAGALGRGDFDGLGALVDEHWEHQRSLDPAIPTPHIDAMIDRARKAGAIGCKALGASGGGCVLIVVPLDRAEDVRLAVAPLGSLVEYTVDTTGVSECA